MQIHKDIEDRLYKYISNGILNTIFYGSQGVGKHTLILKMFNSLNNGIIEKEKIQNLEENGIRIYSTSRYIRFDAKECVRKKANLPKIIEEISRTRDISGDSNTHKIIYIRYINYLEDQQEAFRQLVEDTHLTCRFVFTCRNIDTVDPALNSRCLLVRVPGPPKEKLYEFTKSLIDCKLPLYDSLENNYISKIVEISGNNLNSIKNITLLVNKMAYTNNYELENITEMTAKYIVNELTKATKMCTIQSLAEKYHYSELSILDLCRKMDKKESFIKDIHIYSSIVHPSLYDTFILFLKITKTFNHNVI